MLEFLFFLETNLLKKFTSNEAVRILQRKVDICRIELGEMFRNFKMIVKFQKDPSHNTRLTRRIVVRYICVIFQVRKFQGGKFYKGEETFWWVLNLMGFEFGKI